MQDADNGEMDKQPITLSYNGKVGYTYHPDRGVWVAFSPDTAERIDKPDGFTVNWYGDTLTFETVQEF